LIETRTLPLAPSATLLLQGLREQRHIAQPEPSVLTVGVPWAGSFSGKLLSALPNVEREAREVAAVYRGPSMLLAAQATKENFLSMSVQKDVVHFAGHAVVDLES